MTKSNKIIAGLSVAAAFGFAAMPLMGVHAADGDVLNITDTVKVTVTASCTFTSKNGANSGDASVTGTALNGKYVTLSNATHKFNVFCNNAKGYSVKAYATDLTNGSIATPHNSIEYTAAADWKNAGDAGEYTDTESDGKWTAILTGGDTSAAIAEGASMEGASVIKSKVNEATVAAGEDFTVEYKAYVGTDTKAGAYTGNVYYLLTATTE